jgi:hypothetical protein
MATVQNLIANDPISFSLDQILKFFSRNENRSKAELLV